MPTNSFKNYPMSWKSPIDKTEKPIHRALAKQLEKDILTGYLLPGKITGAEFEALAEREGV